MKYIVEKEFEHAGYKCVVTFISNGYRCGYVGIPTTHSLYGKKYSEYLNIKKSDVKDRKISGIFPLILSAIDDDDRMRIDAFFQCHGGITFSDGGKNSEYPIISDLWWFGFDCGHAGDKNDLDYAIEKFPECGELPHRKLVEHPIEGDVLRTEEYVVSECKKLAEQLKEFEESEE